MRDIFQFCSKSDNGFIWEFLHKLLEEGIENIKSFKGNAPKKFVEYFESQERALKGVNPYLLRFVTSYFIKNVDTQLLEIKNCVPNLFNLHYCMIVYFHDDKKLTIKLLKSCLKLVAFVRGNLAKLAQSGELVPILQNKLLEAIIKETDFNDQSKDSKYFTDQQLILLEIYLKLDEVRKQAAKGQQVVIRKTVDDSIYNKAILDFKRNRVILSESDAFDILLYLKHLNSLSDAEKAFMNVKIETHQPAFDITARASVEIPDVDLLSIEISDKTKIQGIN